MKAGAIVIGVADGIALAITGRLLDDGWPVALLGEEGPALGEAEEALDGEGALVLAVDPEDQDEFGEVLDQAVDALGPVGALIFCARETEPGPGADDADALRRQLDRNVVFAARAFEAARERMADELALVAVQPEGRHAATVSGAALARLVNAQPDADANCRANLLTFARPADAVRIASVVAFLASAESAGLSGQSLHIVAAGRRS